MIIGATPDIVRAEVLQHHDEGLVLQTASDELRLSHNAISVNVKCSEQVPRPLDWIEVSAVSVGVLGLPGGVQGHPRVHTESPTTS